MVRIVEVCCGSYYDAKQAVLGGAKRIELNSALMLGGLTPTTATLGLVKKNFPELQVVAMVRPRGAGFCYSEEEFLVMEAECRELLSAGADGIAFGILTEDGAIDQGRTGKLAELICGAGKEAVFHRAFDCVRDPLEAMEGLISLGIHRVLTSGLKPKATEGAALLKTLQEQFGNRIQILAGSGIHGGNAVPLMRETGITQVHSSCKCWLPDPTTVKNGVSYSMTQGELECCYDGVSARLVQELVSRVAQMEQKE